MDAIRTRDVAALLEIVHDGASDAGDGPFPTSVLSALRRLIPSDAFVGYEEAEFVPRFRVIEDVMVVGEPSSAALIDVIRTFGSQNPMSGDVRARETRVLRLSDLLARRRRRALDFDALVWRPLGIDDALRLWLPPERNRVVSIYLERSGRNYTDREVQLLSLLRPHLARMRANASSRQRATGYHGLTSREAEVLGWIARGSTNREIARVLSISPHTVRKHVENIFEKLEVRTRTGAAACARGIPVVPLFDAG